MKLTDLSIRTILLFLFVAGVVIVSFVLWGEAMDAWLKAFVAQNETQRVALALIFFGLLALDIVLPTPSSLISTACGLYLGFLGGFLCSFGAMCVSAALGYGLGYYGSGLAEKLIGAKDLKQLQYLQAKGGAWILLGLRAVPILAEASLVFAGIGRYPLKQTILQVLLGNAIVSGIYAAMGAVSRTATDSATPAFLGTLALSAIVVLISRRVAKKSTANSVA